MTCRRYTLESAHSGFDSDIISTPMRTVVVAILLSTSWGLLAGCANSQPYVTPQRLERGLVIVLPGIEGRSKLNVDICRGLDKGGVDWAIELYDWTSPVGMLYNQRAEIRNRQKALQIAEHVKRYQWSHPYRPVMLVGHSGGSALAAWTAECLPPSARVDGIIMIAPSLSPQYMLDWALQRTERGIISLNSSRDWVLLGMGTMVAGTMDGHHTSSAGRVGFALPLTTRRREIYGKLYQVGWSGEMASAGHVGGHLSSSSVSFVAAYVAPFVLASRWDAEFVEKVLKRNGTAPLPETPPIPPRATWRPRR